MAESTAGQAAHGLRAVADELRTLGLPLFVKRHPGHKAEDHFRFVGQTAVPSTSLAYALATMTGRPTTTFTSSRAADEFLREYGADWRRAAPDDASNVGVQFLRRKDIQRVYGGDGVAGIATFRDDDAVNCFSDEVTGTYDDEEPDPDRPFGYRGDGRKGDQTFTRGNKLLEKARVARSAVRYWHRPKGGPFTFLFWCAVVGRRWDHGLDDNKQNRKEIVWLLHRVADPRAMELRDQIWDIGNAETENMDAGPGPEVEELPSYASLRERATRQSVIGAHRETYGRQWVRSRYARSAVLARAENICEAPWCTGMPPDKLSSGGAILEVDHVQDLAREGADEPWNMVALCPNCHAAKTRGATAEQTRRKLAAIVERKDRERLAADAADATRRRCPPV